MRTTSRLIFAGILSILVGCMVLAYVLWPRWQAEQQAAQQRQAIEQQVHTLLQQHHPDGLWLLEALQALPLKLEVGANSSISWQAVDPVAMYVRGPELASILFELDTLIHEGSHIYHSRAGSIQAARQQKLTDPAQHFFYYWLRPDSQFLLRGAAVFPASEIASLLPNTVQTERMDAYITTPEETMATQSDGLFGLIDEWVSYYQGLRTEAALLSAVSVQANNLPSAEEQAWQSFATRMSSGYLAYFEFKLYILAYLYHAQTRYPAIYQALSADPTLPELLSKTNLAYQNLLPGYLTLRKQSMAKTTAQSQAFLADLQAQQGRLQTEINHFRYQPLRQQWLNEPLQP